MSKRSRGGDYVVGYARPPKEHQFRKGGLSGNPQGRPFKIRNPLLDYKTVLERLLTIPVDGEPITKTKFQWVLFFLSQRAASGDLRAIRMIERYQEEFRSSVGEEVVDYTASIDRFLKLVEERQNPTDVPRTNRPSLEGDCGEG